MQNWCYQQDSALNGAGIPQDGGAGGIVDFGFTPACGRQDFRLGITSSCVG